MGVGVFYIYRQYRGIAACAQNTDSQAVQRLIQIFFDLGVVEIPVEEARELLRFSHGTIDKMRHLVPVGSHTFEVDCFYGDNEGLIVAEVELSNENEAFERPAWLGKEVTGDRSYYNSQLLKNPYKLWRE